jgi:hypothetical protein
MNLRVAGMHPTVWYIEGKELRSEQDRKLPLLLPYLLLARCLLLIATLASLAFPAAPEPADKLEEAGRPYLQQYLTATRGQEDKLRGVGMEVEIEASLPTLKRQGKFHAFRQISKLGQITYRTVTFQGDNTIKNEVIARYLQAEKESAEKGLSLRPTPENYKFKYYGAFGDGDWKLHLFELTPKQKKQGLFQGWLWIESKSGLPVREQGELVRNPSIFLKRVEFVNDYEIRNGVSVPVRMDSHIQTRVVGKAELSIRYSNLKESPEAPKPFAAR